MKHDASEEKRLTSPESDQSRRTALKTVLVHQKSRQTSQGHRTSLNHVSSDEDDGEFGPTRKEEREERKMRSQRCGRSSFEQLSSNREFAETHMWLVTIRS